jgi:hypothetical protein
MARSFNGTTDKLQFSGAVLSAMPLTMACWFNQSALATDEMIAMSDGTTSNRYELSLVSTGKVRSQVQGTVTTTSATYTANAWHHAAAVFAATNSRAVYLDGGNKVSSTTSAGSPAGLNLTQLGTGPGLSFYAGILAEVALWNVALTDQEINCLAMGVRPNRVRSGNIIAYWPLFGLNSPDVDYSGSKQNLTVTGTALANHAPVTLWTPKRVGAPLIEVAAVGGGLLMRRRRAA